MDWNDLEIDRRSFLRATTFVTVFPNDGERVDPAIARFHPGPEAVALYDYGGQPSELKPRPVLADWPSIESGEGPHRDYGQQRYGEFGYGGSRP